MDDAIDGRDVPIASVDGAVPVDIYAVRSPGRIVNLQPEVVHVVAWEFRIAGLRELSRLVVLGIPSVDDTVVDDNLANAVPDAFAGEGIPRGAVEEPLLDERPKIIVDGKVGRCKDRIVTPCAKQLGNRAVAPPADGNMLQQLDVCTVVVVLLQITQDSLFAEHIPVGHVDVFRT